MSSTRVPFFQPWAELKFRGLGVRPVAPGPSPFPSGPWQVVQVWA